MLHPRLRLRMSIIAAERYRFDNDVKIQGWVLQTIPLSIYFSLQLLSASQICAIVRKGCYASYSNAIDW